ncbi:hypothetical protein ZIOFF_018942 [Zingiber officinale]|uniref:EF-hand domain-containing protein n=1 Tax=Zingiber officinale TaxID=94328 RepID=A0A8J5H8X4_ZINOF|nr:hypothetical protein ZIOFF_018942 [Zingiber officinale]
MVGKLSTSNITGILQKLFMLQVSFLRYYINLVNFRMKLSKKQKYVVWKAADIRKALKEGRKPEPGPPGGDPDQSISSGLSSYTYGTQPSNGLPSSQQFDNASPQHIHKNSEGSEHFVDNYRNVDLPPKNADVTTSEVRPSSEYGILGQRNLTLASIDIGGQGVISWRRVDQPQAKPAVAQDPVNLEMLDIGIGDFQIPPPLEDQLAMTRSEEELCRMMVEVDSNGDGFISLEEFAEINTQTHGFIFFVLAALSCSRPSVDRRETSMSLLHQTHDDAVPP